jgi:hypothetical protein
MKHEGPQPKLVARCRYCVQPVTVKYKKDLWVMLNEDGTEHHCQQYKEDDSDDRNASTRYDSDR